MEVGGGREIIYLSLHCHHRRSDGMNIYRLGLVEAGCDDVSTLGLRRNGDEE